MSQDIYISVQPVTGEDVYINVSPNLAGVLFVNGRDGIVVLNKSDVGLSNVENVSITGVSGYLQYQIDNLDTGYASQTEINLLSGLLGQTGSYLYTTITNLSGDIVSNYATKIELGNTGVFLQNLINALSGYGNGAFATITNLAATGLNLNNKIDTLSGYSNNAFATILNLASTGQNLQNQINNLDLNYASQNEFNSLSGNLTSTGANLQSQINSLYGSGFLTGVDLSPYYLKSNPSGFITGVDLSNYATLNNLELTGQNLQNQINNLDLNYASDLQLSQTGSNLQSQINNLYNSGFITGVDLSNYATKSNLQLTGQNLQSQINNLSNSGFITGVDLSSYATTTNLASTGSTLAGNLASTGSTLDTKINSLSGNLTSNYATITNLESTGSTLQSQINNLNSSGFITSSNVVYTTGSQLIDGEKNFTLLKRSNINVAVIPTLKNIFDTDYPTTFWDIDTLQLAPERNVIYYTPTSWEAPFIRHIRLPKSGNFAGDSLIVSTNYMPASSRINFYKYDPGPGWVLIDSWANSSVDGLYRPFSLSMITYQNSNQYNTPWIKQSNRWNITPPASINSNGTPGDLSFDGTNIYVCVGQNNWRRLSASTWS